MIYLRPHLFLCWFQIDDVSSIVMKPFAPLTEEKKASEGDNKQLKY